MPFLNIYSEKSPIRFFKLDMVTLFIICVNKCLMDIFTKFYLPMYNVGKLSYGPFTTYVKTSIRPTSHKITQADNIKKLCLCLE